MSDDRPVKKLGQLISRSLLYVPTGPLSCEIRLDEAKFLTGLKEALKEAEAEKQKRRKTGERV